MSEQFERIVEFNGAWDKRPKKPGDPNYGVHGMEIRFVLKGDKGAIQFVLFTNWQLPEVADWHASMRHYLHESDRGRRQWPMAADVGYHARSPRYEEQTVCQDECPYIGGPCYYDGSGLLADEWWPEFLAGGTEWLWPKMEERYRALLEKPAEVSP